MKQEQVLSLLEVPFTFSKQPVSIPGDMRPLWRIALIAIFLRISSRGAKSSLTRLHALNWLAKTKANRDQFVRFLEEGRLEDALIIRYEPSFNRAIDLAVGEAIIGRLEGNKLALTPKGDRFAKEIEMQDDCMRHEKEFLKIVGKRFTEAIASEITAVGAL